MVSTETIEELGDIWEGATGQITFTIKENGVGLQPDNLYLTIYDEESGSIVGGRNNSQLSPVSSYVNGSGVLTYNLLVGESGLLSTDTVKPPEYHRIIFKWDWSAGSRVSYFVGRMRVKPREIGA